MVGTNTTIPIYLGTPEREREKRVRERERERETNYYKFTEDSRIVRGPSESEKCYLGK